MAALTVLRAVIHQTPLKLMVAETVRMLDAYEKKGGKREADFVVADRPTVELPKDQVQKLDDAIDQLKRLGVTSTRTTVTRAILRTAPSGPEFVAFAQAFY